MHEISITTNIIEDVISECKKRGINRLRTVSLELGKITSYKKEPIETFYDIMKKENSIIASSELMITEVDGRLKCIDCNAVTIIDDPCLIYCKKCESGNVTIIDGKDIVLESMDGE